jgi:hypothetical protein
MHEIQPGMWVEGLVRRTNGGWSSESREVSEVLAIPLASEPSRPWVHLGHLFVSGDHPVRPDLSDTSQWVTAETMLLDFQAGLDGLYRVPLG